MKSSSKKAATSLNLKQAPHKNIHHTSVSVGEMKNLTEDNINACYSRQGAQAPTVLHY
jgi:hypothetical protein